MSSAAGESCDSTAGGIMLFGVRLVVDSMRKCVSLNNLSQYVHPQDPLVIGSATDKDVTVGYTSADEAGVVHHRSSSSSANTGNRDRKRGVPWTEEEHKLFLLGLQKVGKGDWRGISRNFVKTRTPTQVASHAQKYFLRRSNLNRRRRRSSLFDITTETVSAAPANDQNVIKTDTSCQSPQATSAQGTSSEISTVRLPTTPAYPVLTSPVVSSPAQVDKIMAEKVPMVQDYIDWNSENTHSHQSGISPIPALPFGPATADKAVANFDLNQNSIIDYSSPLSLKLSLSLPSHESNLSQQLAFQGIPSFFSGDNMISVG